MMGLLIYLYFNFNGVETQQWEEVYEESKTLPDRFSIDLIRYTPEEKYGLERGGFIYWSIKRYENTSRWTGWTR